MAYVIGSQKGKDIAKGMKSGETYKASDGSTWTKQSDGSVSVTHNGQTFNNAYTPTSSGGSSGGSKGGNSQYTGSSTGIVTNNSVQQSIKDQMNANSIAWWSADEAGKKQLEETNKLLASYLGSGVTYNQSTGTWGGSADKVSFTDPSDIAGWNNTYNQNNPKEEYESKYDSRIDAILNEILNRDDFSYDVMNDPLYQQYKQMYQREGDRAMKETLAEAAAGAGGMNTYAITAAQQANSYYNSQLNDRIPELYQLAYNMYLQDIEGKVQDLGILQNMDSTQYNRYRDTINDWYNDKNFAYGAYQDAVQQGNWLTNFDYNAMWDNKEFNYNDMWANKEWDYNDEWKNKEWNTTQEDKEYERNQYDQETAKAEVWKYIELGVTPSADLIKRAGMTETDVNLAVAAVKAEQAKKNTSSNDDGGYKGKKDDEKTAVLDAIVGSPVVDDVSGSENYTAVVNACDELASNGDEWAAAAYAKEAKSEGIITQEEYNALLRKYNPLLDAILTTNPASGISPLKTETGKR